MLPIDDHRVLKTPLTIDAQELRAEGGVNLTKRLTAEARADLPDGERLKWLAEGQPLGYVIGGMS